MLQNKFIKSALINAILIPVCLGANESSNEIRITRQLKNKIDTIVVVYAENRSFDNLYGLFPGADGIENALKNPSLYRQLDRDGSVVSPVNETRVQENFLLAA